MQLHPSVQLPALRSARLSTGKREDYVYFIFCIKINLHKHQFTNKMAIYFIFIGFTVLILILIYFLLIISLFTNTNIDAQTTLFGIFGDTIGGTLNPILTFISFIAILAGLYFQQQELKATRDELSRSADAQEKNLLKLDNQISSQELTKFENTFFSFLNHHNTIIQELTFERAPAVINSSGMVKKYRSAIDETYKIIFKTGNTLENAREYLTQEEKKVDHYFRLVYQILKFIDKNYPGEKGSDHFSKEQKRYSSILRASIEHKVLELIAINGASTSETPSYDSYKNIIEKSSFLEHLKFHQELIMEAKPIYNQTAFGESIFIQK